MNAFPTTKPVTIGTPICSQPVFVIAYEPPLLESIKYAEKLKFEGRYEEAVAAYERLIAKTPRNIDLRIRLIKLHLFFENFENAEHLIETALSHSPNNPELLFFKGNVAHLRKHDTDLKRALQLYYIALTASKGIKSEINRKNLQKQILKDIARVYFNLGDIENSIKYNKMALSIDPAYSKAKYNLAIIYMQHKGQNWKAYWNKAIELFKSIEQKLFLEECAQTNFNDYQILRFGKRLEIQIASFATPEYDSFKDYQIIKKVILSYPKYQIPRAANAFWKYFIKYVPTESNMAFSTPQETVQKGSGACDAHVMFISDIFKQAGINNFLITYKVGEHVFHTGCVFESGMGFNYISSDGLIEANAQDVKTLMQFLSDKSEITAQQIFVIEIRNQKPIILRKI